MNAGPLVGVAVSAHLQVSDQAWRAAAEDSNLAGPGVSSAAGIVSLQQCTRRHPALQPALISMIDAPHKEACMTAQTLPGRPPSRIQLGWAQAVHVAPPRQTAPRQGCLQTPACWSTWHGGLRRRCRRKVDAQQCFHLAQLLHLVCVALAALLVTCLQLALLFLPPMCQLHR